MALSYKEKYNTDEKFRKEQLDRGRRYRRSDRGKAVTLARSIDYDNSEHGFITNCICAIFKPSSCKKRGLWPAITKEGVWEELKKHRLDMINKYPESDGNLCIYCEKPWTYKRSRGVGKRIKYRTNFSIDRIDNNKTYQVGNLGFCCAGCNDNKKSATLELMESVLKVAKEKRLK
jgi:hypothetical protein